MENLELGNHRRARVWLGELPSATYTSGETLSHRVEASEAPHEGLELAAVEVFVPRGPHCMYGLLGGRWELGVRGELSITLSIATVNGPTFVDSLASKHDEVRVGLTAEYAQAVLAGVELAKTELPNLPSGRLTLNCAAHGAIVSCDAIFQHVGLILIRVFCSDAVERADEDLIALFPSVVG